MLAVGSTKLVENERETERENISCQLLLFYNVFSEKVSQMSIRMFLPECVTARNMWLITTTKLYSNSPSSAVPTR